MDEFDDSDHDLWYALCAHEVIDKIITSIESTDELRKRRLDMEDKIPHSWKHFPVKRPCREPIFIDLTKEPKQSLITQFMIKKDK